MSKIVQIRFKAINILIKNSQKQLEGRINTKIIIFPKTFEILAHADDVDLIARNEKKLIQIVLTYQKAAPAAGLKKNEQKSRYFYWP